MSVPAASPTLLIIDDDAEIRYSLQRVLGSRYAHVQAAASGEEGIEMAREHKPGILFLDNRMGGMSGLETLQHIRALGYPCMVILMTAFGTTQTAIEAMKFGAFDYVVKPFDAQRVLDLTETAVQALKDLSTTSAQSIPEINADDVKEGLVGSSRPMQEVFKVIGQVAASDVTVMVTGESGTGKELVARAIWRHSHRASGPFMAVNCAAIPENLIESELFGHEKGSFTGATQQRSGKFELCDEGTLFLDEIGDMALPTQTKILRALQEGEIQRVGGSDVLQVDVRLVAATNKDLESMVAEKTFREDLYYRLNVVRLRLPPLRERPEDIPELVAFMLQRLARDYKTKVQQVSAEVLQLLRDHSWPGNVRELENVIHRAAVVAGGDTILTKDLPREFRELTSGKRPVPAPAVEAPAEPVTPPAPAPEAEGAPNGAVPAEPAPVPAASPAEPPPAPPSLSLEGISAKEAYDLVYKCTRREHDKLLLQTMEKEMIQRALVECGGNQVKTSALLGITRATLRKRIDQFNLRY